MQYFQKLNLPYPLKDNNSYKYFLDIKELPVSRQTLGRINNYDTGVDDWQSHINPNLISIFSSLGISPLQIVAFGSKDKKSSKTFIHSDIVLNQDREWEDFPAAINWELVPSHTKMDWYDPTDVEAFKPDTNDYIPGQLQGIKYGSKLNKDPDNLKLLESYIPIVGVPALIRSDIPHQVKSISLAQKRMCLSIRFPKHQITSYADALYVFKDYLLV